MNTPAWNRVSRSSPCPICGKPDWCLVADDGTAAICPRTESPKRIGDAGWLHRLTDEPGRGRISRRLVIQPDLLIADLSTLAVRFQTALTADRLVQFAASLGLSVESLTALQVGWSTAHLAWTFPMTDPATGRIVGIRLRAPNGAKFAVKGGKEGLFIPAIDPVQDAPLLITEGPTDAAALLDLGFPNVVGRPCCTGGMKHLVALIRLRPTKDVVIVADADECGRRGATNLASVLRIHAPAVRVIEPPGTVKDVREWKRAGGT
jgi:hypothetical protein